MYISKRGKKILFVNPQSSIYVFLFTDKTATADAFLYYVSVFKNEVVPVEELGRKSPDTPIIINQKISEGKMMTASNLLLIDKSQLLN